MDWTGSSGARKRDRGDCPPPQKVTQPPRRFTVLKGVPCEIRRAGETAWKKHHTTKDTGFDRYESRQYDLYVFRAGGWEIRVREDYLNHRRELDGRGRLSRAMDFYGMVEPAQGEAQVPADRMTRASGERGD